jgi:outer membrane receptor protein involved in Fe transport
LLVGYSDSSNLSEPIDLLGLGKLNNRLGLPGPQAVRGLSQIQIGNNIASIGSAETGTNNYNAVYQVNERLTWLRGRHTLKFGGSWNYYQSESYYPGNNGQNGFISYTNFNFTGQAIGDFLLDQVSRKGKGSTSDAWTHLQHRVAFYGADDFKITDSLTLNLGLRWAYTSPLVEKDDRQANFDLTNATQLLAGQNGNSRALYDSFYNGWEPRLGFAYRQGERWVYRGGYAISQYMEGTGANQRLPLNPPFFFESQVDYDRTTSAGTIATGFEGLQALDRISGQLRAWDANIRPQFTQQWNAFVEYLVGSRSSINVGYVGSESTDVINTIDANQPLPGTGDPRTWLPTQQRRPLYGINPDITFLITTISRGFHSDYNALQTTFKQRMWQGLDFTANYTLGRARSNARGFFGSGGVAAGTSTSTPVNSRDLEANYGPAYFDARHIFSLAGYWELPFGRERRIGANWNRALDAVAGGWSLSYALTAHTGYPITVLDSSNPSLQASRSTERPNRIGSGEVENPTLDRWIDRSAFVSAPLGEFGNSGIGILRAPGYNNLDLSVTKRFATFGRQYLAFRAEFFNALNHPSFGPPQANIQSTAFGTITSTVSDPRIIQLVAKYYF